MKYLNVHRQSWNFPRQSWNFPRVLCLGLISVGALASSSVLAQENPKADSSALGQELLQKNSKIRSCHVVWKRVIRFHPRTGVDPDERAAHTLAWAKQNGISQEQSEALAGMTRQRTIDRRQASVNTALLDFVRVGNKVKVDITYPDLGDKGIEFFDGTNSLYGHIQVANGPVNLRAAVIRDSSEVLSHSARRTHAARFLLGIPLTQSFSDYNPAVTPQKVRLHTAPDGEVTMKIGDVPYSEFTFSQAHGSLAPFKSYNFNSLTKSNEVLFPKEKASPNIVARDFREYDKGLWFPSAVTYNTSSSTTEYTLLSAKFNDEVDPAGVLLPAGIRVTDRRFGEGVKPLAYVPKDGQILSDAEAKKLLGFKADEEVVRSKEAKQTPKSQVSKAAIPLFGLLCIGFGATLWARAKKVE